MTATDPEIEKIRNYITLPILQDATQWLHRKPRSQEEKIAYSDAAWNVVALVFTHVEQLNHTSAALEKLLFN